MKVKRGSVVYLQKYDAVFMLHELNSIPAGMLEHFFDNDEGYIFMNGFDDGLTFDIEIKDPNSADWIMKQDWIINFDDYRKRKAEEVESFMQDFIDYIEAKLEAFNEDGPAKKNEEEIDNWLKRQQHKLMSLDLMVGYLIKKARFKVPRRRLIDIFRLKKSEEPSL